MSYHKYNELCNLLEQEETEPLSEQYTKDEVGRSLGYASIVILCLYVLRWCLMSIFVKSMGKQKENKKLTKKIREIVDDPSVTIWEIKSREVNAFTMGKSNLYYFSGLVKKLKLTEDELMAIMLHEYGHYRGKHILKYSSVFYPSAFILNFIFGILTKHRSVEIAFTSLVPLGMIMTLYDVTYGRKHELEADRTMAEFGYKKEATSALKKMYKFFRHLICEQLDINPNSKECKDLIKEMHKFDEHPEFEKRIEEISNLKMIKSLSSKLMRKLSKMMPILKKWIR